MAVRFEEMREAVEETAAPREYEEPDLEAYDVDFGHTPPQP